MIESLCTSVSSVSSELAGELSKEPKSFIRHFATTCAVMHLGLLLHRGIGFQILKCTSETQKWRSCGVLIPLRMALLPSLHRSAWMQTPAHILARGTHYLGLHVGFVRYVGLPFLPQAA